jgi:hypothetical protein
MSFMAVAYVPAFLEDRAQYVKEHHNGLYGAAELIISNFFIGIPYLCRSRPLSFFFFFFIPSFPGLSLSLSLSPPWTMINRP